MAKKGQDSNIQIFMRIRPSKSPSALMNKDELDDDIIHFNIPTDKSHLFIDNTKTNFNFKFNGVIGMEATQEQVFNKIGRPAIMNALEGFNSTVFAYGQTGSGKTFTITGGAERYVDRGIIPRSLSLLFAEFQARSDMQFTAHISYFQIYNERGYDLLDEKNSGSNFQNMPSVKIMEDEWGNSIMQNLGMHLCNSEEDALNLLFLGDVNRAYASTNMNETSSRSHCIFTISIEGRKTGSDMVMRSKLHLVDLAGSERVKKSGATGKTFNEATYINTSLFYLEMVIVALHEKREHIPYRNSFLTSVLRDSLGGNCKTIMIANINAEESHTSETIGTCRFAQRVASIKNEAIINEDMDPSLQIKRLKDEVKRLKGEVDFLKGESGEGDTLTDEERENLIQKCKEYVDDTDPYAELNVSPLTLVKIKDCFAILKNLVLEARRHGGGGVANANKDSAYVAPDIAGTDSAELLKQIAALKKKLQERENEIAILVNMVKQAKGAVNGVTQAMEVPQIQTPPVQEEEPQPKKQLPAICQKVPFPADRSLLEDAQQSFEYFKGIYPSVKAMEENKILMKEKYVEAKNLGESVNKARNKINYLKSTIEQIRRERAIEGLLENKEGEEGEGPPPDPEEERLKAEIDEEKQVYKNSFTALKTLKTEIEHIQRLLQKTSKKMQADFDTWYEAATSDLQEAAPPQEAGAKAPSPPVPRRAWGTPDSSSSSRRNRGMAAQSQSPTPLSAQKEDTPKPSTFQEGVKFPPLTGNKEADEDILAFYKAKEELLKRSKK